MTWFRPQVEKGPQDTEHKVYLYELTDINYILWVIIQYYHFKFCCTNCFSFGLWGLFQMCPFDTSIHSLSTSFHSSITRCSRLTLYFPHLRPTSNLPSLQGALGSCFVLQNNVQKPQSGCQVCLLLLECCCIQVLSAKRTNP